MNQIWRISNNKKNVEMSNWSYDWSVHPEMRKKVWKKRMERWLEWEFEKHIVSFFLGLNKAFTIKPFKIFTLLIKSQCNFSSFFFFSFTAKLGFRMETRFPHIQLLQSLGKYKAKMPVLYSNNFLHKSKGFLGSPTRNN